MLRYFGLTSQYPFLRILGEIYYYGVIAVAGIFLLFMAARLWLRLGYPRRRTMIFSGVFIVACGPLAYVGSRTAGMFYRPLEEWGVRLLLENIFHGTTHTFHGGLVLSTLFLVFLSILFRFRISEILDAIFLYVPLLHAFGRSACFIVGCCWGRYLNLNLFGLSVGFQNPIPLYAILTNLCIFLLLRRIHARIYADPMVEDRIRERFRGSVFATYLILYAPVRIFFEVFRFERKIFYGLTQAQVIMGFFLLVGIIMFLIIGYRCYKKPARIETARNRALVNLLSMAGLLASFVFLNFLIFYLTRQLKTWPWPFRPVVSLADAYARIIYYLPMLLIPVYSVYWLHKFREPIWPWFKWQQFSYTFFIGLVISIYYCIELLVLKQVALRGLLFWPPVVTLSVMNAVAEEIMYRLALYNLIRRASFSGTTANIIQALVYSLIHFMIAGPIFGVYAIVFGLVMGMIAIRSKSILPAIICHFIIDLAAIGMPMLRLR